MWGTHMCHSWKTTQYIPISYRKDKLFNFTKLWIIQKSHYHIIRFHTDNIHPFTKVPGPRLHGGYMFKSLGYIFRGKKHAQIPWIGSLQDNSQHLQSHSTFTWRENPRIQIFTRWSPLSPWMPHHCGPCIAWRMRCIQQITVRPASFGV